MVWIGVRVIARLLANEKPRTVRRLVRECHGHAIAAVSDGRWCEALEHLWQAQRAGGRPRSNALRAERWWVLGRSFWLRGELGCAELAFGRAFRCFQASKRPAAALVVLLELLALYREAGAEMRLDACWERIQDEAEHRGLALAVLRLLAAAGDADSPRSMSLHELEELAQRGSPGQGLGEPALTATDPRDRDRRAREPGASVERG